MNAQTRRLAGLLQDLMFHFGAQEIGDECCGEKISPGEFRALRTALLLDVCTMQDIARRASITKGGATRIITRLEEKGLAQREKDQKDGRVCCVTLTEEGESLLSQIEDQLTNKMMAILEAMDPAMRDILIISLNSFLQTARRQSSGK